ncbi:MAG: PIN domain-containing protein [Candidatus Korarchaeota archaeon]|nr:PIN domain-containing protein [Candidatus Korarchaeota archaeon]
METFWKLKSEKMALDTGVLMEYIVKRAPYRRKVLALFESAAEGNIKLYVSPITLSETIYVASRIYEASSIPNPNEEALKYVEWLKDKMSVINVTEEVMTRAGELKKELRIALPDCYVIATAEQVEASPLFRKVEREMKPVLSKLEELGVLFLDRIE